MAAARSATLEIQLIADVIRLQADMKKAQGAIDGMTAGAAAGFNRAGAAASKMAADAQKAAAGTREYAADVARLKSALDPAWQAQQKYNQQVELGKRAFASGAIDRQQFIAHMRQINAELKGIEQPMARATGGSRQFMMQMSQVAQQTAAGGNALQALALQLPDIAIGMGSAGASAGRFASFLGGPWGIAVASAAAVLVPFIGKLFDTAAAADTARGALAALQKAQREQDAENNRQILSQQEIQSMYNKRADVVRRVAAAEAILAKTGPDTARQSGINRLKAEVDKLTFSINTAEEDVAKAKAASAKSTDEVTAATTRATTATRVHSAAVSEAAQAYQQAFDSAQSYIEGLDRQIAEFGKTEKELRALETARRMDAAATDEQRAAIKRRADVIENQIGVDKLSKEMEQSANWRKEGLADVEKEIKLLGLQGTAREIAALALQKEGFKAEALKNHVLDVNAAWDDYQSKQLELINGRSFLDEETKKAAILEDRLNSLTGALSGGPLGGIIGTLTSRDPVSSLLGMGGVGTLAGLFTSGGQKALADQRKTMESALVSVFGDKAKNIAGGIADIFQGAGIGATVAGVVGNGSAGAQFGGMAGGALGQVFGEKMGKTALEGIAKGLGDFAGPIGSIVGSIAGSLIGGLFKKSATGSVILSGNQVTGTSGNGQRAGQASDLGSSVIQALDKLSAILGVSATGAASVSIGMRNDQFKVDPTGAGRTKESDVLTFSNAADAVKAALRIQIEKGVFEGLSEGVKKFLLNGDLEQQLSKFANYKGALDAARQAEDPVNYQINELAKARASIMSIATEIGASAEEVAKLEKYYADQHVKIVEEAGAEALAAAKELASQRSALEIQIMELSGDSAGALAEVRRLEKAAADASLGPLYDRIYALQDEAKASAAAAEAKAKADERYGLDTRLLELMGATAILRERELAALDPANRALQETIWQLEDLQKVTSQSRDLDKRLARATGNTALADAMDQQDFLAQYGADLQEKALAVWNAEHKKVADTANKYSQMLADAAGRMGAANDNLASANDNLASSMAETLDKFRGFSDALRKFRDGLYTTAFDDARNFGGLRGQYSNTAMMARRGDETALAGLPDIAKQYLDAAKDRSSTREDYERIVESVLRDTGAAIRTSDAVADGLDYQRRAAEGIDKLNARVEALAAGQDDLREEIRTGNSDTRRTREVLEDVTDGDGIRLAS